MEITKPLHKINLLTYYDIFEYIRIIVRSSGHRKLPVIRTPTYFSYKTLINLLKHPRQRRLNLGFWNPPSDALKS